MNSLQVFSPEFMKYFYIWMFSSTILSIIFKMIDLTVRMKGPLGKDGGKSRVIPLSQNYEAISYIIILPIKVFFSIIFFAVCFFVKFIMGVLFCSLKWLVSNFIFLIFLTAGIIGNWFVVQLELSAMGWMATVKLIGALFIVFVESIGTVAYGKVIKKSLQNKSKELKLVLISLVGVYAVDFLMGVNLVYFQIKNYGRASGFMSRLAYVAPLITVLAPLISSTLAGFFGPNKVEFNLDFKFGNTENFSKDMRKIEEDLSQAMKAFFILIIALIFFPYTIFSFIEKCFLHIKKWWEQ